MYVMFNCVVVLGEDGTARCSRPHHLPIENTTSIVTFISVKYGGVGMNPQLGGPAPCASHISLS